MDLIRCLILLLLCPLYSFSQKGLRNQKIDGFRGIWFELNQKYPYGDKYSGGLGTYTAKHIPLAIYAPEVDKTFFVYGGTTVKEARHLLAMISFYDHKTGLVAKPTVVYDKIAVDDPHDNPSLLIDDQGYIWVFVSGRGSKRVGIKLRSHNPYQIDQFDIRSEEEFTYPQVWQTDQGIFHFFTKYTGVRELYFERQKDDGSWTDDQKLAGIKEEGFERSGHYQLSNSFQSGAIVGTFFNRHRDGHPDSRTDLYYVQSRDLGKHWETVDGRPVSIPVTKVDHDVRVYDYLSESKNVYMKDMAFDAKGFPICLYITSAGHEPGPDNAPYEWTITRWDGRQWLTFVMGESDHNYDMGSLYVSERLWRIVAPTENPPQAYGVGGEIAIWSSEDRGSTWIKERIVTDQSATNHGYVRRPVNFKAPFSFFWADGDPHQFSQSHLYFGDFDGKIWQLPYQMNDDLASPIMIK